MNMWNIEMQQFSSWIYVGFLKLENVVCVSLGTVEYFQWNAAEVRRVKRVIEFLEGRRTNVEISAFIIEIIFFYFTDKLDINVPRKIFECLETWLT